MSEFQLNSNPPTEMEVNLDDDKAPVSKEFNGATLSIGESNAANGPPEVEFKGPRQPPVSMPELSGEGLRRERPFSASMRSTASTKSITSMNPYVVQNDYTIKSFFAYKEGTFESAVEFCEKNCARSELDGNLTGAWLLTQIDHWDNEREKLVLLTENSLLICRYDFIASRVLEHRRVMIHNIDTITTGDFVYPERSLMPARNHGGVKISWAKGTLPTFGQKWNPFCSDLPFLMFSHHHIIYHNKERETVTYNVDDFCESLTQAVNQVLRVKNPGQTVKMVEEPILIESYASISSQIFNQSGLGFFKERGGISF